MTLDVLEKKIEEYLNKEYDCNCELCKINDKDIYN